jgi:hypothetical protein
MKSVDPNSLILPAVVVILALLAVAANYRLEIGSSGLKFELNASLAASAKKGD